MQKRKSSHQYEWKYNKSDLKYCPRCGANFVLEDVHIPNQPQLVCHACQFVFYLDPKLVVMAVITLQNKILLLKRAEAPGQGKWALLAGHVERGEDPAQALMREAVEETGLSITVGDVFKISSFVESGMVQLIFEAEAFNDAMTLNDESLDGQFFTIPNIPWNDIAFASTKETLRLFISKIAEIN